MKRLDISHPAIRSALALVLPLLSLLALTPQAVASPPSTLGVQGVLRAAGGGAAADGNYIATFGLYDAASGGAALWQEGPIIITVTSGTFARVLGADKPLPANLFAGGKAGWLGAAIEKDPELPRVALQAVAWALRAVQAEALGCSGCVEAKHIATGTISAENVGFTWAGAKTKGGPAADLACTGCVSVAEMSFDGDLDLGGNGLKAKKLTAADISGQTISATAFIGDGSKLTGLKVPAGACKNKGEVVSGIAADGSLLCVSGLDANSLPPDGIVQVSNGLLSNRYVDMTLSSKTPLAIPDNNPVGVFDELDVPDLGIAKKLTVHVALTNSDISGLQVLLFDPTNASHVLYEKGAKGDKLEGNWPDPDKQVSGDLSAWAGKNPKGKWRLKVVDTIAAKGGNDGAVSVFEIKVETISSKKIDATGDLTVHGNLSAKLGVDFNKGEAKLMRLQNAPGAPVKCDASVLGLVYYDTKTSELKVCNGSDYKAFATTTPVGGQGKPAANCKAILDAGDAAGDGVYWLQHNGKAIKAWCDMAGGGWTLAASWAYSGNKPAQWGKDAVNAADPKPGVQHALPFADIFAKPTQVKMVYLPNKQTISYNMAPGATWTFASGGARIKVAGGNYLIWDSQNGVAPAGICFANGGYSTGYTCDGNSGQVAGHGLFNGNTADEFCNCSGHGWKYAAGGCNATVCGATGQVAVWLR